MGLSFFSPDTLFISKSSLLLPSQSTALGPYREVAEWSNATVSKTVIPATVSGVRIPPSLRFELKIKSEKLKMPLSSLY